MPFRRGRAPGRLVSWAVTWFPSKTMSIVPKLVANQRARKWLTLRSERLPLGRALLGWAGVVRKNGDPDLVLAWHYVRGSSRSAGGNVGAAAAGAPLLRCGRRRPRRRHGAVPAGRSEDGYGVADIDVGGAGRAAEWRRGRPD